MSVDSGLFDEPGPRGRRRIRIVSVLAFCAIVFLVYRAVAQFELHGELAAAKWVPFAQWQIDRFLLAGLGNTVKSAAVAAAATLAGGLLVALARLSRRRPLSLLAAAYVEVFRSIPLLIVLLTFLLALPKYGIKLPLYWQLTVPLIISHSAKMAEVYRAGILSVERGQSEAAYSLGLSYSQTMRMVVVPQALRRLSPTIVSELVAMLKGTALGYIVSYGELLYSGKVMGEYTQNLVQTYIVIALIYAAMNGSLSWIARRLETRAAPRRTPVRRGAGALLSRG